MAARTEHRFLYHPGVYEAQAKLKQGRVSRREFLRFATLLGTGAAAAYVLAACGAPTPAVTAGPAGGAIKRGGAIRVGTQVQAIDHPARYSLIGFDANITRAVNEYLTETDKDNLTHPYLLDSWAASDDLKTWTLKLRQGIKWYQNGAVTEELVADHVLFNFQQWLDPAIGSSIASLWGGFLTIANVEVQGKHTLVLHLDNPKLDVPESLFHYPAQIIHPNFDGDISNGQNAGTGPMVLAEFKVGERARTVRREGYWQNGADGKPLPYIDEIVHIDLGNDQTAAIAALQGGQIDTIYSPTVDTYLALRNDPKVRVESIGTAQSRVLRFRVDQAPWDNNDVRKAVKMAQNRQKILDQAYFGQGLLGHDVHVSPVNPEWAPMEVPEYDPEGAKALLEAAGQADLTFKLSVGSGWTDVVAYAETLAQDAAAAGITVEIDSMPVDSYWSVWTEVPVGITPWSHRPLAITNLALAYTAKADGTPGDWNESRWVDEEFSRILLQAQGTLDLEARRALVGQLEQIQRERGSIAIAWWQNFWDVWNPAFQNVQPHPTAYNLWREVWYDPDKAA
ncbi:MAG: ABC transporter substrate-binding protein [Anaerolineales bacterium]|nr:ABC transporter substrate-binding protein [Anaerolineales bacterium]